MTKFQLDLNQNIKRTYQNADNLQNSRMLQFNL